MVVVVGGHAGDLFHYVHAVKNLAEDDVFSIQPWGRLAGDEELTAIGVTTCEIRDVIGHEVETERVE